MIRVLHYGLGPVGAAVAKQIADRSGLKSVGGVDIDPKKADRPLAEVVGLTTRSRVRVWGDPQSALTITRPDVVVLCTSSSIAKVMPQIDIILKAKIPIVSTTEELSYPFRTHARAARRIDELARKAKVAVLGTGVNPGFAMDALPIALTAVCQRVDRVTVTRIQDARFRRLPFQQKIGAGLTPKQFERQVKEGTVRHVGFTESIAMIADTMGWKLDRVTDSVQPKIATAPVSSEFLAVAPGEVCGVMQDGVGFRKGEALVRLHMEAYLGASESYDAVDIEGTPPLSLRIPGGLPGDVATASMIVNSIPKVLNAAPGLHTMRDLPLPSFYPGTQRA